MIQIDEKNTKYNFTLLDQVIDFLVSLKIKPHIELGFKNHTFFEKVGPSIFENKTKNHISMIENNKGFLEEMIRHWTRRYGLEEVESWYIELEKNSAVQESVDTDSICKENWKKRKVNKVPGVSLDKASMALLSKVL